MRCTMNESIVHDKTPATTQISLANVRYQTAVFKTPPSRNFGVVFLSLSKAIPFCNLLPGIGMDDYSQAPCIFTA